MCPHIAIKFDLGQSSNRFLNAFHARQLSRAIGDVHDRNGLSRSMLQRQKTLKSPIISSSLITHVLPTQEFCDNVQNLCCRMHGDLLFVHLVDRSVFYVEISRFVLRPFSGGVSATMR